MNKICNRCGKEFEYVSGYFKNVCKECVKNYCSKCSTEIPRDYNSAKNILDRGKELASMEKASNTEQFVQQEASVKSEAISSTGVRL